MSNMLFQNFGPEVKEKASIFVPSIGKVTIVVLLRNLLVCFNRSVPNTQDASQIPNRPLQRLIQNRRVDDVQPAAATERPGTLEASS